MKKLIIFGIVIVLLAVIVTAVLNNITDAVFIPERPEVRTKLKGDITFDCGNETMSKHFSVSSLEHLEGDFEQEVKFMCDKEVSKVVDWTGRKYKTENNTRFFSDAIPIYRCEIRKLDWPCERLSQYYLLPNGKCWNTELGNKLCTSGWELQ